MFLRAPIGGQGGIGKRIAGENTSIERGKDEYNNQQPEIAHLRKVIDMYCRNLLIEYLRVEPTFSAGDTVNR